MSDELKTDLTLAFSENGTVDLEADSGEMRGVSGKQNLVQALKLLLLCDKGELSGLGHARHGTSIRDFLGEPLIRSNLELMRRIVRKAILRDPRVEEIISVNVTPCSSEPGAVYVIAEVKAIDDSEIKVEVKVTENL